MTIDWVMVGALGTILYGVAFLVSVFLVLTQLQQQSKEQFVTGTTGSFAIWEDDDFQRAQQWVLYELEQKTWREFIAAHRGGYGERAFIRVGGFYNRVGYLVTYRLLGGNDRLLLDTVSGLAIAVWQKIEPLVLEARLIENSTLFQDYQRMLPRCYECYVPTTPAPPAVTAGANEEERVAQNIK